MLDYFFVGLIGGVVGTAELTSRYGNVGQIFSIAPSYYYIALNVGASCLMYALMGSTELPITNEYMNDEIARILLSGTSAMFLLRSSFGSFKISGNAVDIGPVAFLQVFLNEADRAYDRRRSEQDLIEIADIMHDVNFNKVELDLPQACLAMMKNISPDEQQQLGNDVSNIKKTMNGRTKSLVLGLILSDLTGTDLLREAVLSMGDRIKIPEEEQEMEEESQEDKAKKMAGLAEKYKKKKS